MYLKADACQKDKFFFNGSILPTKYVREHGELSSEDYIKILRAYKGRILEPVIGWTTHHSIVEFKGKWYLFYHDSSMSNGVNHLRCVKFRELKYNEDGTIIPMKPYEE